MEFVVELLPKGWKLKEEVQFRVCLEKTMISEGWKVRKKVYYYGNYRERRFIDC